jgi:hypothetical protein
MKRLIPLFLFLSLFLTTPARCAAQSIVTATVTLTNAAGTTNGQTILVNSHLRTWTNVVQNANVQIQTSGNTNFAGSNLFIAFVSFPEAGLSVSHPSSNVVRFTSFPGQPLSITIFSNWATLSMTTNVMTNATIVRVPKEVTGSMERTNVSSGLVSWINDPANTNKFDTNAFAFADFQFPDMVGLTNFIQTLSTNGTNLTVEVVATYSNFVRLALVSQTNFNNSLGTAAFHAAEDFEPQCEVLSNICLLGNAFLNGRSYIKDPNEIVLQHTNLSPVIERLHASDSGHFILNDETGNTFLEYDTSHNFFVNDANNIHRWESDADGNSFVRSGSGKSSLHIPPSSDAILTFGAVVANTPNWPTTLMGSVTNFINDAGSISTSETAVNQFTMPANTMTNVGDTFIRTVGVKFDTAGTYEVKVYFASDTIFDASFTTSGTGTLSVTCEVTVDDITSGTGSIRYNCSAVGQGTSVTTFSTIDKANTIDFTTGQLCKVGLIASSGSDHAKVITDNVRLALSPAWAGF